MAGRSVSDALAKVYAAFRGVAKPRKVPACPCCITASEVCTLLETPLHELTPEQLSSYAGSVFLTSGSTADFRYFLPRILDISLHERYWYPDREIVLGKLPLAGWKSWADTEIQPLLSLFEAAFDEAVADPDDGSEVDSWICGLALADSDVKPYLRTLLRPSALSALIGFYERNSTHLRKAKLSNAFWKGHKANSAPVVAWFQSADVQAVVMRHYERLAQGDV